MENPLSILEINAKYSNQLNDNIPKVEKVFMVGVKEPITWKQWEHLSSKLPAEILFKAEYCTETKELTLECIPTFLKTT